MNHRRIAFNIIGIIAAITLLFPLFDFVAKVMNAQSDVAYFGPIIAFSGAFIIGLVIVSLGKQTYNQLKSSEECQTKATGKSSKKKENNKK